MFDLVLPRRVLGKQLLSEDAFVLRLERRNDPVKAGRHLQVSLPGTESRAYSLYSGEDDPWLEILVRRVEGGQLTPRLARLEPGDRVVVEAPKGRFTLAKAHPLERLLLLATGTGVAPFRSFVRSNPELDYFLVHGVRTLADDFAAEFCPAERRVVCVSAPSAPWTPRGPQRSGRLTGWLEALEPNAYDRAYLCGNARMIAQAPPILVDKGVAEARIHTEIYF